MRYQLLNCVKLIGSIDRNNIELVCYVYDHDHECTKVLFGQTVYNGFTATLKGLKFQHISYLHNSLQEIIVKGEAFKHTHYVLLDLKLIGTYWFPIEQKTQPLNAKEAAIFLSKQL